MEYSPTHYVKQFCNDLIVFLMETFIIFIVCFSSFYIVFVEGPICVVLVM